jgi:hypothetical protein
MAISYLSRRAIHIELQSLQLLTYSGLLYLCERVATNVTTDVSPWRTRDLQIQDNDNDHEDLVEIDDMLLDELDLEELYLSGLLRRLLRQLLRRLLG